MCTRLLYITKVVTFTVTLLLSISYAQTGPIEWRYGKSIKILATEQYTATGITLSQGDTIMIVVEGVAKMDPNQPYYGWVGPSGDGRTMGCSGCPTSDAPLFSVIGKIGNSDPFFVGKRILIEADSAGELFIGVNDSIIGDNDGYFLVFISAQKPL